MSENKHQNVMMCSMDSGINQFFKESSMTNSQIFIHVIMNPWITDSFKILLDSDMKQVVVFMGVIESLTQLICLKQLSH